MNTNSPMTSPDAEGWIEWKGGECPAEQGMAVYVRCAEGDDQALADGAMASWEWYDEKSPDRIIAYRIIHP